MKLVKIGILFLVSLLVLAACTGKSGETAKALGLESALGEEISHYDSHGGFHGDGTTCIVYRVDGEDVLREIQNSSQWREFPLDTTARALVYGSSDEAGRHIGPMITDQEGNPLVPEIRNGYYLLIDRQEGAQGNLLDRYSFNFTLGLYDTDTNILYFCKLDT